MASGSIGDRQSKTHKIEQHSAGLEKKHDTNEWHCVLCIPSTISFSNSLYVEGLMRNVTIKKSCYRRKAIGVRNVRLWLFMFI